jgi:hypothetical protein
LANALTLLPDTTAAETPEPGALITERLGRLNVLVGSDARVRLDRLVALDKLEDPEVTAALDVAGLDKLAVIAYVAGLLLDNAAPESPCAEMVDKVLVVVFGLALASARPVSIVERPERLDRLLAA